MLPNLYWSSIPLGPFTIQVWGLCVALGMGVAIWAAQRLAKQRGLDPAIILDGSFWVILVSLVGARGWFVVTEWQLFTNDLLGVVRFWEGGMAMTGGLVGGIVAGIVFLNYKRVNVWKYLDLFIFALPLGETIGRLGCFFIFDHPGTPTSFWLGEVYYVDGIVRHNHGLYLVISGLLLFTLFYWLTKKTTAQPPTLIILYLFWSGAARLILDTWRIADTRFAGLTAAQWAGIAMIIVAVGLFGQRQNIRKYYIKG